jgi:phosphoenolpyruvate carboxylase
MISFLMTEISELRGTVTVIDAEQSSFKEQYEALRASYLDLEDIMLREIADSEDVNEKQKKKFKKTESTPPTGDARRHASRSKDVPDHLSSEKDDTSNQSRNYLLQMKKIITTLNRWVPPCPD